jgi:hypothetical protein
MLEDLLHEVVTVFNQGVLQLGVVEDDKLLVLLLLSIFDVIDHIVETLDGVTIFLNRIITLISFKDSLHTSGGSDIVQLSYFFGSVPMFSVLFHVGGNVINTLDNLLGLGSDFTISGDSELVLFFLLHWFGQFPSSFPLANLLLLCKILVVDISPHTSLGKGSCGVASTLLGFIEFLLDV